MVYLLSDLHGDISPLSEYIKIATDDDLLILLGDSELNFANTPENRKFTEDFLKIKKNIAIIDGNHENFAYLHSFHEEEWNGGKVHRLSENIVFLRRGNVFTIENIRFFVFGGCKSSPKWKEMGLWFDGEEPSDEDIETAYNNLSSCNYTVDYILTHKYENDPNRSHLTEKLYELVKFIDEKVSFKKWYAGHWHIDETYDDKHVFVYNTLKTL